MNNNTIILLEPAHTLSENVTINELMIKLTNEFHKFAVYQDLDVLFFIHPNVSALGKSEFVFSRLSLVACL